MRIFYAGLFRENLAKRCNARAVRGDSVGEEISAMQGSRLLRPIRFRRFNNCMFIALEIIRFITIPEDSIKLENIRR